jgi:hypothetical protein
MICGRPRRVGGLGPRSSPPTATAQVDPRGHRITSRNRGSTGFREESPLERLFRDAHTLSQHAFAAPARFESAAQAILGREVDWAFFNL